MLKQTAGYTMHRAEVFMVKILSGGFVVDKHYKEQRPLNLVILLSRTNNENEDFNLETGSKQKVKMLFIEVNTLRYTYIN